MMLATLLTGAALQAAFPPPPAPPAPPTPPAAVAAAPSPPAPPLPPLPPLARGDGPQVLSFDNDGQHVTIIKRRADGPAVPLHIGEPGANVLRYKDADGRDVTVVTSKPITQADAEKMERNMRAKLPELTAQAAADAHARTRDIQVIVRDAHEQAAQARAEAREQGAAARAEAAKAREYAQVIVRQMKDEQGNWRFDTGPSTTVFRPGEFPGAGDIKALRDEVHALRVEIDELRAQLKSGPTH